MTTQARQSTELRQAEIIATMLHLPPRRNPADITTTDIAKAMRVTQGALFRHFATKRSHSPGRGRGIEAQLLGALARRRQAAPDALAALRAMFLAHVRLRKSLPGVPRLIFAELQRAASPVRLVVQKIMQRYRQVLAETLALAMAAKRIRADVDCQAAASLFLGGIQGLVIQSMLSGRWMRPWSARPKPSWTLPGRTGGSHEARGLFSRKLGLPFAAAALVIGFAFVVARSGPLAPTQVTTVRVASRYGIAGLVRHWHGRSPAQLFHRADGGGAGQGDPCRYRRVGAGRQLLAEIEPVDLDERLRSSEAQPRPVHPARSSRPRRSAAMCWRAWKVAELNAKLSRAGRQTLRQRQCRRKPAAGAGLAQAAVDSSNANLQGARRSDAFEGRPGGLCAATKTTCAWWRRTMAW